MICRSYPFEISIPEAHPKGANFKSGRKRREGPTLANPQPRTPQLSWQQLELWVRLAQDGHLPAWDVIIRHFYERVHRYIFKQVKDRTQAEDLTQEVFLGAFRRVAQVKHPRAFAAWLKTLTKRLVRQYHRHRVLQAFRASRFVGRVVFTPTDGWGALKVLEHQEEVQTLRTALNCLRGADRQAVERYYFEGQTLREMSLVFGCPIGTLKRRLHAARSRLRKHLQTQRALKPS